MKFKYYRECFNIFLHSIRVGWELMFGFIKLSRMHMPVITIFGGAKDPKKDGSAKKAYELARRFVAQDISVLTGGGPGIMEAANCGAASVHKNDKGKKRPDTIGIAVTGIDTWFVSSCYYPTVRVSYFFMRKWLLIRYSVGFIVFPGGIGTLDELFDLLNLLKHHRIPSFPVVLIDKDYWEPLLQLLRLSLKRGLLDKELMNLFFITDDVDEAFTFVYESCKRFKK